MILSHFLKRLRFIQPIKPIIYWYQWLITCFPPYPRQPSKRLGLHFLHKMSWQSALALFRHGIHQWHYHKHLMQFKSRSSLLQSWTCDNIALLRFPLKRNEWFNACRYWVFTARHSDITAGLLSQLQLSTPNFVHFKLAYSTWKTMRQFKDAKSEHYDIKPKNCMFPVMVWRK